MYEDQTSRPWSCNDLARFSTSVDEEESQMHYRDVGHTFVKIC